MLRTAAYRRISNASSSSVAALPALIAAAFALNNAWAAETTLPAIEVSGRAPAQAITKVTEDVEASPASVTVLSKQDLDRKTITTYGDIFRGVTGVSVLEYGQGLVAYEVKARGFASGHGRDMAVYLDGVPLNITGSQHTNGYMDLAQLIPELINRVEIVRGPFSVLSGNHAVAGSVQLTTDANASSMVKFAIDSFGQVRALPVLNADVGGGKLLLAADLTKGEGYTKQSDIERGNLFVRYAFPLAGGTAAVRVQAYDAEAEAPGYLSLADIRAGRTGKRDALSEGIGDAKTQQNVALNYRSDDVEGEHAGGGWFAAIYGVNDIRRRWSNFNLATPIGAEASLQQERDHLHQFGFDVRKTTSFSTAGMPSQIVAGVQYDRQRIEGRRFMTDSDHDRIYGPGDVVSRDRRVLTDTQSLYAQYQLQPLSVFKLTAGLRYDRLKFDVDLKPGDDTFGAAVAAGVPTSVSTSEDQWSPKIGAALTLLDSLSHRVELYGNAARGLKSPYPFSDYFENIGASSVLPDLDISAVRSYEAGLQGSMPDGSANWRIAFWNTRQDKEADRNPVGVFQSFRKTKRDGFDVEGAIRVAPQTRLFANYSHVKARIQDPASPGAVYIPNVVEWTGALGVDGSFAFGAHKFDYSLSNTIVGPQPITAENETHTRRYNRYDARLAYTRADWRGANAFVSLVGYDRQLEEIAFDFGGGAVGVSPRPKMRIVTGIQIPL